MSEQQMWFLTCNRFDSQNSIGIPSCNCSSSLVDCYLESSISVRLNLPRTVLMKIKRSKAIEDWAQRPDASLWYAVCWAEGRISISDAVFEEAKRAAFFKDVMGFGHCHRLLLPYDLRPILTLSGIPFQRTDFPSALWRRPHSLSVSKPSRFLV